MPNKPSLPFSHLLLAQLAKINQFSLLPVAEAQRKWTNDGSFRPGSHSVLLRMRREYHKRHSKASTPDAGESNDDAMSRAGKTPRETPPDDKDFQRQRKLNDVLQRQTLAQVILARRSEVSSMLC